MAQDINNEELEQRGFKMTSISDDIFLDINYNIYNRRTKSFKNILNNKKGLTYYSKDTGNRSCITIPKLHMITFPDEYGVSVKYNNFDNYLINKDGSLFSLAKGNKIKIMPPSKSNVYPSVKIVKTGANNSSSVNFHLLMANTFIVKPESKTRLEVNHKDGDKKNNSLANLEWVTHSENVQHAYDTGLTKGSLRKYKIYSLDFILIGEVLGRAKACEIIGNYDKQQLERDAINNTRAADKTSLVKSGDFYVKMVDTKVLD